jgi:hypothetical protein
MEGQMMQSIKKGTPGAEQVTVSFWVKSSNTGTYIAEMRDNDNSRACSRSYTINVANTWEKETITFPADTTGQLHNDNERSLELAFWFGAGSEYAGGTLQTTWGASAGADNTRAAGQLNLANRAGNYIAFTGIQWEVGPVATPFEFEDIGTTLRKCQRYYKRITRANSNGSGDAGVLNFCDWNGTESYSGNMCLSPSMRTAPSFSYSNLSHFTYFEGGSQKTPMTGFQLLGASPEYCEIKIEWSGGLTTGRAGWLRINDASGGFNFSAEL